MVQSSDTKPTVKKRSTVAYFTVAALLLCILALLPFAITSVFADALDQSAKVFEIDPPSPGLAVSTTINLQVVTVNDWDGTASIRVSTNQSCKGQCPWGDQFLFVSVYGDTSGKSVERPSTQTVTLPSNARDVTQTISLPIYGDPIRYPFDLYRLGIGIVVERIHSDGTKQTLTAEEAREYVSVTIQGRIPRIKMNPPQPIDPATLDDAGNDEPYAVVQLLEFERPLYLKVLTILLVMLVSAAAAYAVFMRPLDQLIINSGALVLGVWGIRSIMLGSALPGLTAVDLGLSVVILFLLVTITVRTLYLLEQSSAIRLPWILGKPLPPAAPSPPVRTPDNVPDDERVTIP
ncbi:MAG: hypothetical protein AB7R89_18195 [Dehalococcoidia bacterium]